MKTHFTLKWIILLLIVLVSIISAQSKRPLNVITFNIRLDLASDSANAWDHRKELVVDLLRYHQADLVGLQEALPHQLDYLVKELPEFGWFGVGRDDGKRAGEITAILYRKARLDTITTSTFWCSQTPDKPGLGWDAACNRTTTLGKFYDKKNKQTIHHFNTHLDHVGLTARLEGAKLIRQKVNELSGN